jgi:hypothetical protein
MNLSRRTSALVAEEATNDHEARRAAIKLSAELSTARVRIFALEAENMGLRDALRALNRHEGIAKDLAAIRNAEREACARIADELGFCIGAQRIRERK